MALFCNPSAPYRAKLTPVMDIAVLKEHLAGMVGAVLWNISASMRMVRKLAVEPTLFNSILPFSPSPA
jgi:hypothetical protein